MIELTQLSVIQLARALREGHFSSREAVLAFLQRIDRLDGRLHAFLYLARESALAQADEADRRLAALRRSPDESVPPLLGVPAAIKDVLCVAEMPCTCGSHILEGFYPPFHATAVQRLLEAGMVLLGKTNTDEFAMGSSTENSAYGPTRNPWDLSRVPGGSSGGSAAAVAARLAPAALGTDTGGSVRQPAAFCGVTGLKPTYGRVSRYGLVAYGSSLDSVGAFGRSAEDVAAIYNQIAGFDPKDATSAGRAHAPLHLEAPFDLAGLRIGLPQEYFIGGIQPQIDQAIHRSLEVLTGMGAHLVPISLPHTQYALPVYYLIAPAEASANLARFDGIRYGPRQPADSLEQVFRQTRSRKFGPEVKRRIMLGTYALSAGYYDAYYGQAQKVRTLIKRDFEAAFQQVDVIAAPVAPTTAFRLGEHGDDPLAMYLEDIFTLPANLAGVPGLAFPVGFDAHHLPIGMQLMGPHFQEDLLLRVCHAYQSATSWHMAMPSGWEH
jgi:aspartyl-tRNA(Asn)/glutamyl-tRNA(Gln) amidotransferase subunit A